MRVEIWTNCRHKHSRILIKLRLDLLLLCLRHYNLKSNIRTKPRKHGEPRFVMFVFEHSSKWKREQREREKLGVGEKSVAKINETDDCACISFLKQFVYGKNGYFAFHNIFNFRRHLKIILKNAKLCCHRTSASSWTMIRTRIIILSDNMTKVHASDCILICVCWPSFISILTLLWASDADRCNQSPSKIYFLFDNAI